MTQWLPPLGEHDIIVVAVQNCEYNPPERSEEWVSNARKVRALFAVGTYAAFAERCKLHSVGKGKDNAGPGSANILVCITFTPRAARAACSHRSYLVPPCALLARIGLA